MKFLFSFLVLALVASPALAADVAWSIDKAHTTVGFSARHLGISKVRGQFKNFDGNFAGDETSGKLSKVEAEVETKSVDTGIAKRDDHLRSDDFFNAEKFPKLKFKAKSIEWKGNNFVAKVELTMRDVTKTVDFNGELLGVQKVDFGDGPQLRAGYTATAKVNRKEFGLKFSSLAEGVAVVADEVEITIDLQVSHKLAAAAPAAVEKKPAK